MPERRRPPTTNRSSIPRLRTPLQLGGANVLHDIGFPAGGDGVSIARDRPLIPNPLNPRGFAKPLFVLTQSASPRPGPTSLRLLRLLGPASPARLFVLDSVRKPDEHLCDLLAARAADLGQDGLASAALARTLRPYRRVQRSSLPQAATELGAGHGLPRRSTTLSRSADSTATPAWVAAAHVGRHARRRCCASCCTRQGHCRCSCCQDFDTV